MHNINKKQHSILIFILLATYTGTDLLPNSDITFNYITWFSIIHIISSYLRFYPQKFHTNNKLLLTATILFLLIASADIIINHGYYGRVSDSNAIFAVLISISSFLLFKNLNIPKNNIINTIASASFGVLLIHANSDTMRQWLWNDTINCTGHYSYTLFFPFLAVFITYILCTLLEIIRIKTVETPVNNQAEKACIYAWKTLNKFIQNFE